MTFLSDIRVARIAGSSGEWELIAPLIYQGNRDRFTVPIGFRTDFASIPRIFAWLIPKNGSHDAAAIVHDYLYRHQPLVPSPAPLRSMQRISRRDADRLFRRIMRELGTNCVRYNLMYAGVRIGGWVAYNKNRRLLDGAPQA